MSKVVLIDGAPWRRAVDGLFLHPMKAGCGSNLLENIKPTGSGI